MSLNSRRGRGEEGEVGLVWPLGLWCGPVVRPSGRGVQIDFGPWALGRPETCAEVMRGPLGRVRVMGFVASATARLVED